MTCPLCKAKMVGGETNLPYELDGERFIVMKYVPALVCARCGDAVVDMDILRRVEKIEVTANGMG